MLSLLSGPLCLQKTYCTPIWIVNVNILSRVVYLLSLVRGDAIVVGVLWGVREAVLVNFRCSHRHVSHRRTCLESLKSIDLSLNAGGNDSVIKQLNYVSKG